MRFFLPFLERVNCCLRELHCFQRALLRKKTWRSQILHLNLKLGADHHFELTEILRKIGYAMSYLDFCTLNLF